MSDMERAAELQRSVKWGELETAEKGLSDYSDEDARRAAVHTRQDIVSVVSLLGALCGYARAIKWVGLTLVVGVAIVIAKIW